MLDHQFVPRVVPEHRRALDEDNPLEIVRLDAQIEERPQPVADLVPRAGLRLGTLRWPPRPGGPGEFGKFVVLCTNAVLLPRHLHKFTPSKNFAWMVHIDGLRKRHDESVSKEGVFDQAVAAIRQAKEAGFGVYTNSTFFSTDSPQAVIDVLNYLNDDLKVDRMEISPGYAYEKAPAQDRFLGAQGDIGGLAEAIA